MFSRRINSAVLPVVMDLINSRMSSKKRFTAVLEGLMSILPEYLRTLNPRKSKPSLMCVMWVFSSESSSPGSAVARRSRTRPLEPVVGPLLEALDELFDAVEDQLGRFVEWGNVGTGKLDELRVRDVIRDVARPSEGPRRQSGASNH
jgi:hypothetical protein